MNILKKILFVGLVVLSFFGASEILLAADTRSENQDELVGGERVPARAPAAARNAQSRKRYPGGADEDDLQVQATLPIPSRTFDPNAPMSGRASDDDDNSSTTPPPAND